MIQSFWDWMFSSVENAINLLGTLYNNTTLRPFFDLLLVVVGIAIIIKFILAPLLGIGIIGGSDKAEREYERKSKNKPMDGSYKQVK